MLVQVWGLGSSKLDWEEQLANLEKVLGTPSARSASALFDCNVACGHLCITCGCAGVALAGSACCHLNLAGRTHALPSSVEPVVITGCLCWH